jgi:predicted HicB family RNase H-like nuclease
MEEMPRRHERARGRPPNPDTSPENVRLDLRITAELRRRIRHAAADADMGLGAWVKLAIDEKLERQEHGERIE